MAMGTRDLCKLKERKKSVGIVCRWVLPKKDEIRDFGTEIVRERKKRRLYLE